MIKFYLAAPFFNPEQLSAVKDVEKILKKVPNYFAEFHSPRSTGVIKNMTPKEKAEMGPILFDSNIFHMDSCDCMIVITDWSDKGTMFEMGYAYAMDKTIITYSPSGAKANLMLQHATPMHSNDLEILSLLINMYADSDTKNWDRAVEGFREKTLISDE